MATFIRDIALQKCVICSKQTDQCCSLCRRTFYCSAEHQEVDWHMKHKFTCEGRTINEDQNNQFKIYSNDYKGEAEERKEEREKSRKKEVVRDDKAINQFLGLLSKRLEMRQKILQNFSKINYRSVNIVKESLIHQVNELVQLSDHINASFKPSLTKYLSQEYGIFVNSFILNIESTADGVLMLKAYDTANMQDQVKQCLISLTKSCQTFPTSDTNELLNHIETYKGLLKSIIQIAQVYSLDKISELMYGRYIKLVEQFEGIWEQIYAYFNMGVWYSQKTYYEKAIKSFMYALELINSHKKDINETILFKADCNFNIALGMWTCGDKLKAIQKMQQAYQDRVNGIGKNSLEASVCLLKLAEWFKEGQKWEECLQYLDECHRIQKQHSQVEALEKVRRLIADIYDKIRGQRARNEEMMEPKASRYYENLLRRQTETDEKIKETEESYRKIIPQESFSSRLLKDERQFVLFKVNITPEMFETYSPAQISKLNSLFTHTDEKMEKAQAIRILMDSNFTAGLDPEQREEFLKNNLIS